MSGAALGTNATKTCGVQGSIVDDEFIILQRIMDVDAMSAPNLIHAERLRYASKHDLSETLEDI